jgi:hypothetical protein
MESILFLKKSDESIKARNFSEERKRNCVSKEAADPTVLLEALLSSLLIDAKEHRDVCSGHSTSFCADHKQESEQGSSLLT